MAAGEYWYTNDKQSGEALGAQPVGEGWEAIGTLRGTCLGDDWGVLVRYGYTVRACTHN
jgi:hypothetical protein